MQIDLATFDSVKERFETKYGSLDIAFRELKANERRKLFRYKKFTGRLRGLYTKPEREAILTVIDEYHAELVRYLTIRTSRAYG